MSEGPTFESLEGLRGTGKSTVAPLLAEARGAVLVPTVPMLFQPLRRQLDLRENVEARMCFYLSALFTAADDIRRHLEAGTPVVVESYFARCLATHRALGARLDVTLPDGLPQPVTYRLDCTEGERQRRLIERDKAVSPWDVLSEVDPSRIIRAYARFPMHRVDTMHRTPDEVVRAILTVDTDDNTAGDIVFRGGARRGDAEPVGAHPDVLPSVPGHGQGAHSC